MPKGPKGERRPTDVIGAAIKVGRIAVGDEEESAFDPNEGKDPKAREMGAKGGRARARALTGEKRSAIAKKAAKARWKKASRAEAE